MRRHSPRHVPVAVTTPALVGLSWGLALGLVDGLPALLEGDPLAALGRRLLTVAYIAVFDALLLGLLLAVVGLLAGTVLRLAGRRPGRTRLLSLSAGLCVALTTTAYGLLHGPGVSPTVVLLALASGVGLGGLVCATQGAGFPRKPGAAPRTVLGVLGVTVVVLLSVALFRATARDWPILNPRVTDQSPTPERPNILLISIDALRADRLGVYGNDPAVSPRIDDLARRGIVFRQAIAQGNSTLPSVSSFLTSLHPTELGDISGRAWALDDMRVTLAEALQAAGYRTQAFVANGHLVPNKGFAQGFDGFVSPEPGRPYGLDRLRGETIVAGLACRHGLFLCKSFDAGYRMLFDRLLVMEDEGGRVNDLARRFIRVHRDEQFFLWLHYMEPHAAYSPRQPLSRLPASVGPEREAFLRTWQPSNKTLPMVLRQDDTAALLSLYDGEIREVDGWVGGIWDEIEARGLADRTLLVLIADHGDEFGDHGDYGHGHTVYQELIWVPLVVVGPQVTTPGRVVDTPVPLLDIMPTLLDVAAAPSPDLVRGQSLLAVLQGTDSAPRPIYSESPARRSSYDQKAVRSGDYKLVYTLEPGRIELYDLRTDPCEQKDLSAVEAGRAAAMLHDLRAWTAGALRTWAALPQSGKEPGELDAAMEDALQKIGY